MASRGLPAGSRARWPRFVRPSEAQLLGLVQAGELDYAWSYRSLAETAGLRWVSLPPAIDLSDAARAEAYARPGCGCLVRVKARRLGRIPRRADPLRADHPPGPPHPGGRTSVCAFRAFAGGPAILAKAGFESCSDRRSPEAGRAGGCYHRASHAHFTANASSHERHSQHPVPPERAHSQLCTGEPGARGTQGGAQGAGRQRDRHPGDREWPGCPSQAKP